MLNPLRLALFVFLAASASAQSTWIVDAAGGPGSHFVSLQAAVDSVADGDRLIVRSGTYAPVVIDAKALTVVAASSSRPFIGDFAAQTGATPFTVRNLAADQLVRVRGLLVFHSVVGAPSAMRVENCAGPVWIEDIFADSYAGTSLELESADHVVLVRSLFQANAGVAPASGDFPGAPGLRATDCADVRAHECTFRGSHGVLLPGGPLPTARVHGGDGLLLANSTVRLFGCEGLAGNGSANMVGGCLVGGDGGAGLRVVAGEIATIVATASVFQGGPGSMYDAICDVAPLAGLDVDLGLGTLIDGGTAHSAWSVASPAFGASSMTLTAEGEPGDFVAAYYSFEPVSVLTVAGLGVHLDPFAFYFLTTTALPTSLPVNVSVPLPTLMPGTQSESFVSQALFLGANGSVRISGPTWTLVLP